MCGIAGLVRGHEASIDNLEQLCSVMTHTLRHRGPDDEGLWVDMSAGIALGHRRLSILDLTLAGRQPMTSHCGRYVIVFNGEIYNFAEMRRELESQSRTIQLRGRSDTEVLVNAIAQWGIEKTLHRTIGMFAFAVWDRVGMILHLARDRMGIKPLYYAHVDNDFAFASELKALTLHPGFSRDISRHALALYIRHGYIPGPYSIYERAYKLMPGHILTFRVSDESISLDQRIETKAYWSAEQVWTNGAADSWEGSDREALNELESLLSDSVRLRMMADVPVGAFLSGGIDSSTVVALMQLASDRPVNTFSIGSPYPDYDEAKYAQAVARHLGTNHTELYVTEKEARDVIPILPRMFDEPFADSSQIPTFLVSQLARRHVTVVLSGDGGDELFWGYQRYLVALSYWRQRQRIPVQVRERLGRWIQSVPDLPINILAYPLAPLLHRRGFRKTFFAHKVKSLAEILGENSFASFYRHLVSQVAEPLELVRDARELPTVFANCESVRNNLDLYQLPSYLDTVSYLRDDILLKVDIASMAVALEVRVPILDHRVVEFAAKMPSRFKYCNGQQKWLLRRLLSRYVPKHLIDRPKRGFAVPVGNWLRGPLRDWAEGLLGETLLKSQGYLEQDLVRRMWAEHLSGRYNRSGSLWTILMFQQWIQHQES